MSLPQSPALAFELEQVAAVHDAIKEWRGHDDIAQELAPVVDTSIRCDDDGRLLIAAHEHIGKLISGGGRKFPQEEIIDDQELGGVHLRAELAQRAKLARFVQLLDQRMCLAVEDLVAAPNSELRNGVNAGLVCHIFAGLKCPLFASGGHWLLDFWGLC